MLLYDCGTDTTLATLEFIWVNKSYIWMDGVGRGKHLVGRGKTRGKACSRLVQWRWGARWVPWKSEGPRTKADDLRFIWPWLGWDSDGLKWKLTAKSCWGLELVMLRLHKPAWVHRLSFYKILFQRCSKIYLPILKMNLTSFILSLFNVDLSSQFCICWYHHHRFTTRLLMKVFA